MTETTINNKLVRLQPVDTVPEMNLYLSDTPHVLTFGERYQCWAQAWVGGRALARYILDNPQLVAGKTVVDIASGSGIVAIAAKLAGATRVVAIDDYAPCIQAIVLNAAANNVEIEAIQQDVFQYTPSYGDLFLAGDPFYHENLFSYLDSTYRPVILGSPIRYDPWYHFYITPEKILQTYTLQSPLGFDDKLEFETHVWQMNA
jgi:predicted nicotinamide N-methyase